MTTETLEDNLNNKIKAHIIEFPNDKPGDIAALFNVGRQKVYDARETLRRHKMINRAGKRNPRRKAPAPMVVTYPEKKDEYEVVKLKAEIERLNVIIAYLEKKVG
jgi:hypothetical protein